MDQTPPPAAPADDNDQLVTWMRTRHAQCPVCDYDLHALPEPKCPECGVPLTLEVRSPNQLPGPWIMALIGLSMAAGFDLVVVVVAVIATILHGMPPWNFIFAMAGFFALGLMCVLALGVLIRKRRAWMRAIPTTQWQRAWVICTIVLVVHALYGWYLSEL